MKFLKKVLHSLTLDYEVAAITCWQDGQPLSQVNILKKMNELNYQNFKSRPGNAGRNMADALHDYLKN